MEFFKNIRLVAVLPLLTTFVALILSFLCLFAGRSPNYLENYDVLVMNTSRIAVNIFETPTSTSSSPTPQSSSFFDTISGEVLGGLQNLTSAVEQEIEGAINDSLQSFARTLGLYDFYSVHILDYCEGYYSPNGTASRDVQHCSKANGFSNLNPTAVLQQQLNNQGLDITLKDLQWPSAIDEEFQMLRTGLRAIFVLYILAIITTGLSFVGAGVGLFLYSKPVVVGNLVLTVFSSLFLLISSAAVTAGSAHAVSIINEYGNDIDINASKGQKLIGITWAATVLVLLAMAVWAADVFVLNRRQKITPKQLQ